jgi:hypothetical protein
MYKNRLTKLARQLERELATAVNIGKRLLWQIDRCKGPDDFSYDFLGEARETLAKLEAMK